MIALSVFIVGILFSLRQTTSLWALRIIQKIWPHYRNGQYLCLYIVYDEFTDLEVIQNDPRGEELIDYIWQASFRAFDATPLK